MIPTPIKEGIPFKKGDIVRIYEQNKTRLAEVKTDVEWNKDFERWGSVWLVNEYPPLFTHKGGIQCWECAAIRGGCPEDV